MDVGCAGFIEGGWGGGPALANTITPYANKTSSLKNLKSSPIASNYMGRGACWSFCKEDCRPQLD